MSHESKRPWSKKTKNKNKMEPSPKAKHLAQVEIIKTSYQHFKIKLKWVNFLVKYNKKKKGSDTHLRNTET